jgi:hypothetical protein
VNNPRNPIVVLAIHTDKCFDEFALFRCDLGGKRVMGRLSILLLLALGGRVGNRLERMEAADDASCRKIITERGDTNPQAYAACRANFQQYRMQRAVISSGY